MKALIYTTITTLCFFIFISCRTKDGAPGPAGDSNLLKQGTVNGTLYYKNFKGDSIKENFNYEYYETLVDNYFIYTAGRGYGFTLFREGLNDADDSFEFSANGGLDQLGNPIAPTGASIDFSYVRNLNNNLFTFKDTDVQGLETVYMPSQSGSTCQISNFSFDIVSGRLRFNFDVVYNYQDISSASRYFSNPARVKGAVDIVLVRKQANVVPPTQPKI